MVDALKATIRATSANADGGGGGGVKQLAASADGAVRARYIIPGQAPASPAVPTQCRVCCADNGRVTAA